MWLNRIIPTILVMQIGSGDRVPGLPGEPVATEAEIATLERNINKKRQELHFYMNVCAGGIKAGVKDGLKNETCTTPSGTEFKVSHAIPKREWSIETYKMMETVRVMADIEGACYRTSLAETLKHK